jgi:hypothetical protein
MLISGTEKIKRTFLCPWNICRRGVSQFRVCTFYLIVNEEARVRKCVRRASLMSAMPVVNETKEDWKTLVFEECLSSVCIFR